MISMKIGQLTSPIIVFLVFLGCSVNENNDVVEVNNSLKAILTEQELQNSRYVIIVPKAGCGGCIDKAILFLKDKIESLSDTQVILTGIEDKKLLRIELGDVFLKKPNVHLDDERLFQNLKIMSIYPQLVKIEDGKAIEIQELDPSSGDMDQLLDK